MDDLVYGLARRESDYIARVLTIPEIWRLKLFRQSYCMLLLLVTAT